jgi:hypothetical protein
VGKTIGLGWRLVTPTYDYLCALGHTTETRAGYEDSAIPCPICGDKAVRLAVYQEQGVICETGAVKGVADRRRRDHAGEKLNHLRKGSVEAYRQTGVQTGPMQIRDWDR